MIKEELKKFIKVLEIAEKLCPQELGELENLDIYLTSGIDKPSVKLEKGALIISSQLLHKPVDQIFYIIFCEEIFHLKTIRQGRVEEKYLEKEVIIERKSNKTGEVIGSGKFTLYNVGADFAAHIYGKQTLNKYIRRINRLKLPIYLSPKLEELTISPFKSKEISSVVPKKISKEEKIDPLFWCRIVEKALDQHGKITLDYVTYLGCHLEIRYEESQANRRGNTKKTSGERSKKERQKVPRVGHKGKEVPDQEDD